MSGLEDYNQQIEAMLSGDNGVREYTETLDGSKGLIWTISGPNEDNHFLPIEEVRFNTSFNQDSTAQYYRYDLQDPMPLEARKATLTELLGFAIAAGRDMPDEPLSRRVQGLVFEKLHEERTAIDGLFKLFDKHQIKPSYSPSQSIVSGI